MVSSYVVGSFHPCHQYLINIYGVLQPWLHGRLWFYGTALGWHMRPSGNVWQLLHLMTPVWCRDHSVYASSQWEMTLHCNVISHWLGAYTEWPCLVRSSGILPDPWFNIKMSVIYQYRKSQCGDKMVIRLSYLRCGNSFLYWYDCIFILNQPPWELLLLI